MAGSDYPPFTPDRWLAGVAELPLRPAAREKIRTIGAARPPGLTAG